MSENRSGSEAHRIPAATVSSATTELDTFFMDFDPQSAMGSGENNESNEATVDMDDYHTTESSNSLNDYSNMPFSSQLDYDFPIRESTHIRVDRVGLMTQSHNNHEADIVHPTVSVATASVSPPLNNNSVPEFLYQLTKMLTENNNDVIEWSHGMLYEKKTSF
jgi:hypothetical protein